MPLREQVEFEPMADEIVIVAETVEQVADTFERHRAGEIYIRGMGQAPGCVWKFHCAVGERAKVWHEAMRRKKFSEIEQRTKP